MRTASIGRRFGDWLGVVPEEEAPPVTATRRTGDVESRGELAARQTEAASDAAAAAPDHPVMSFRDVVNQRRHVPG